MFFCIIALKEFPISYFGIFFHADFMGKLVLLSLIASSCYIWSVIAKKAIWFVRMKKNTQEFKEYIFSKTNFKRLIVEESSMYFELYDALLTLYADAYADKDRATIDAMMDGIVKKWEQDFEKELDYLSVVGSIAPFVGLFGTVWGIMNSFQAIAQANTTSISVVAPGISEALFATAVGLFVAIPASVATHLFYSKIEGMIKDFQLFSIKLVAKFEKMK